MKIKFRIWDTYKKTMMTMYQQEEISGWTKEGELIFEKGFIPIQFTGLLDRLGNEIYFDDIVKISSPENAEGLSGTALISRTINNGVGILYDFNGDELENIFAVDEGGMQQDIWEDESVWDIEIISNIYENPELLTPKRST
jgi:hypothetical protein